MRKKILALSFVTVFLFGLFAGSIFANGFGFKDIPESHRSYEEITAITEQGLMEGFKNNTFRPNKKVTREELAVALYNLQNSQEVQEPKEDENQERVNPVKDVETFKFYYSEGSSDIAQKMKQQDLVVIEPLAMEKKYIEEAQQSGTLIYGYINSMEADNWNVNLMNKFKEEDFFHDKNGERRYIEQWDAYLMDITSEHYQDVMINEIQEQIVNKGLDGVFLDTVGDIEDYHYRELEVMKSQQEAMKKFMERIKEEFPGISIGQNWGFDTLENYTGQYVDFMLWENFSASNVKNDEWTQEKVEQVKRVKAQHGTEIFVISFKEKTETEKVAKENGFKIHHNSRGTYFNDW